MLANAAVGGQLGMSILGPPTAAVPAPVFSMKNSLQGANPSGIFTIVLWPREVLQPEQRRFAGACLRCLAAAALEVSDETDFSSAHRDSQWVILALAGCIR